MGRATAPPVKRFPSGSRRQNGGRRGGLQNGPSRKQATWTGPPPREGTNSIWTGPQPRRSALLTAAAASSDLDRASPAASSGQDGRGLSRRTHGAAAATPSAARTCRRPPRTTPASRAAPRAPRARRPLARRAARTPGERARRRRRARRRGRRGRARGRAWRVRLPWWRPPRAGRVRRGGRSTRETSRGRRKKPSAAARRSSGGGPAPCHVPPPPPPPVRLRGCPHLRRAARSIAPP
mmetsp:Transcript_68657/g.188329  ORF Transcript_68657/g.188329 Transcript_68657/m.188329 type:complete len:237 (+) Transcript_68657:342-1052(+)